MLEVLEGADGLFLVAFQQVPAPVHHAEFVVQGFHGGRVGGGIPLPPGQKKVLL